MQPEPEDSVPASKSAAEDLCDKLENGLKEDKESRERSTVLGGSTEAQGH